jgi:hypothetical protein
MLAVADIRNIVRILTFRIEERGHKLQPIEKVGSRNGYKLVEWRNLISPNYRLARAHHVRQMYYP